MNRILSASILAIAAGGIFAGAAGAGGQRPSTARTAQPAVTWAQTDPALLWKDEVTGKVLSVTGTTAQLEIRNERTIDLDASVAIEQHKVNALKAGAFITAVGAYDGKGVFHARAIFRAKSLPSAWPADR
jgi:hypothetical protein